MALRVGGLEGALDAPWSCATHGGVVVFSCCRASEMRDDVAWVVSVLMDAPDLHVCRALVHSDRGL